MGGIASAQPTTPPPPPPAKQPGAPATPPKQPTPPATPPKQPAPPAKQPAPAKGREITGTVLDVDGKPIANATITVPNGPTATTAADGTFKVTVPLTNLTVDVAAEGYAARQVTVLGAATALALQVVLVKPAAPPPPETRVIAGVVLDASKNAVANAIVRVRGTQLTATTAADGTFAIPGVAAGDATLDIEATGQPPTNVVVPTGKSAVSVTVGQAAPPPPVARTVRGRVTDPSSKEPIVAAQVKNLSTGQIVFTDANGTYALENVDPGPFRVEISAGEHETVTRDVLPEQTTVDVTLALVQGEQIVIEGRAPVIVKQNLANGASVIDDKDLNRVTSATLDAAMQGKLAGANLQFNSGAPGGGAQLRLRGISTINGQSSPLYVIDGVIISNVEVASGANAITAAAAGGNASNQDNPVNRIADLNPNDIETVEVLKGASAAALYGSKAANGVVIITTKRGKSGENRVEVVQRFGVAAPSNKIGSRTFTSVDQVMDAFGADSPLVQAFMDANGRTFDHEAEITRTTFARETIASASGGTENGNYFGSVLVRDEPGVVTGTFYQKQTGRLSLGYRLGERLRLGLTANLIHSKSDRGLTNNDNTGTSYYVVLSGTPNFVDLEPSGGLFPRNPAVGSGANPLQTVTLLNNREDVWRLIGGSTASLDLYRSDDKQHEVKLLANFGADSFQQKNNILSPPELIFEPTTDGLAGTSLDASTTNLNWNVGTGAVWSYRPESNKWRSALSGGLTYENVDLTSVYVVAQNLTAGQPNVDAGTSVGINENRLRTKDAGLYVQEEVATLEDRLSVLGGLLGERSSLNGDTGKYFVYPKLAAVYSLLPPDKEQDPANKPMFETLRVRAAYGEAGNRPNYGQKFTALNATGNIDGNAGLTIGGAAGDPNIEPERQREFEIGSDAAWRDNKYVAEVTLYQRNISNMLLQRALPTSTGFTTQFFNGGSMRNRGLELALQASPLPTKTVDWTTRAILTLNRSQITDLPEGIDFFDITAAGFGTGLGAYRIEEGKSATQIVGTINADGDVAVVGNGEPDFRVGWSNVVKWKQFTFGALVDWQQGSDIINLTRLLYDFGNNSPDADAAAMRLEAFTNGDVRPYIEDATFVKLRELSVAYDVPKKVASQIGPLRTLQISASARNVLTFTNYSGLDPEVSNFGSQPIGRNYDVAPYPPSRSFWLSISAGL
ncbi:MAG TPA: SusC/RagA family TonB-linked outer membrane protein [Kofleriaceae bacterium]|nr:SusC/RagA family TonB-linked outer membrane protein [Kofleriaceae bacterium]